MPVFLMSVELFLQLEFVFITEIVLLVLVYCISPWLRRGRIALFIYDNILIVAIVHVNSQVSFGYKRPLPCPKGQSDIY